MASVTMSIIRRARAALPTRSAARLACTWIASCAFLACAAVRMDGEEWRAQLDPPVQEGDVGSTPEEEPDPALRDPLRGGAVLVYRIERERSGGVERWWMTVIGPASAASAGGNTLGSMTLRPPHGEVLAVELLSPTYRATVEIVDPAGKRTVSEAELPLGFLSEGLARVCEASAALDLDDVSPERLPKDWLDAFIRSMACCFSLGNLGTDNRALHGLLRQLIQMPSWWKWLAPGVRVYLSVDPFEAERTRTEHGPGWILPAELRLQGDPAFYAKLVVVPPRGALRITGGIVAGEGFAPNRPDQKVRWHLERAYFEGAGTGGERIPIWTGKPDPGGASRRSSPGEAGAESE